MTEYFSKSYIRDWLIKIHKESNGLDFSTILSMYWDHTDKKLNGEQKIILTESVKKLIDNEVLDFKEGKTYLRNDKE